MHPGSFRAQFLAQLPIVEQVVPIRHLVEDAFLHSPRMLNDRSRLEMCLIICMGGEVDLWLWISEQDWEAAR